MGPSLPNLMALAVLGAAVALAAVLAGNQGPLSSQASQVSGGAEPQPSAEEAEGREERPEPSTFDGPGQLANRPQGGQSLLEHAILTLESRRSVSANIVYHLNLFGQRPVGQGVYLEQRSERGVLLRYESRFQLAGEPSSLLQVCDGRYLWVYRKLGDEETLSQVDLRRVQQELEATGNLDKIVAVGWWPGLGGIPRLLRQLHDYLQFGPVEEDQLDDRNGPVPVWKLRGRWKPERLAESLPDRKTKAAERLGPGVLPGHVPDRVVLYLGKTDEFPYRIEYRRRASGAKDAADRPLLTMQLHTVHLNATVHPTHFLYNPGDLECVDRTIPFLKELGLRE